MKMTKLMAALVVVTIMMTSVVFGATTARTTTTYDLSTTGEVTFDVQTVVTGTNARKLTYVLYNGTTPTEDNIIYIDQRDGSPDHTFVVNDIPAADFVGAKIIANDDVSAEAATAPVGNFYKLVKGEMAGISNVSFTTAGEGAVYDFDKNGIAYLPVGVDVIATFFAEAGKTLDTVTQGGVALDPTLNTVQLASNYAVDQEVVLDATVTEVASGSLVAVDPNYILGEDEDGHDTVTFLLSTSGVEDVKKVGLTVKISGEFTATMEDMRPHATMADVEAFGIQITDTNDFGLEGKTFTTSVSYNGVELDLVEGTNYYVVK